MTAPGRMELAFRLRIHRAAFNLLFAASCLEMFGCELLGLPTDLLPQSSFVTRGTAALVQDDAFGPCLVWIGENGITYHLFQNPNLENEVFDLVTTPGVTSRLELLERDDLQVACLRGTVVQVQDVLEVVP